MKCGRFRNVLILLAIAALLCPLGLVALTHLGNERRERGKMIAAVLYAIKAHRDVYHAYPPCERRDELGRPLCSWRLRIRPFFEQVTRPNERLDQSWYCPDNMGWLPEGYARYFTLETGTSGEVTTFTARVVAVTGPGTAFDRPEGHAGSIPADTILLIELAESGIVWTQPGDLDIGSMPAKIRQGLDGEGVHVGFADGYVWYLDRTVPLEQLRLFCTIEGARQHDREKQLLPYRRGEPIRDGGWEW